jgi:bleomycin hydrolase
MKKLLFLFIVAGIVVSAQAQEEQEKAAAANHIETTTGYEFTTVVDLETTPIKDQAKSSTCWSFSGVSFLESEMIRVHHLRIDLSEMFIVRMAYVDKARKYVRMHGKIAFAPGGEVPDVLYVLDKYGAMPEDAYTGLKNINDRYNHNKLQKSLKSYLDELIAQAEIKPDWETGFNKILDEHLGVLPKSFNYLGKEFTAESFAKEVVKLNAEDYISITSFSHHPFYSSFALEIPDNWMWSVSYNVPLDEMMGVLEQSLLNGYTVAWATDNSEKGFSSRNGLALLPTKSWTEMSSAEQEMIFAGPHTEMTVTQEWRQLNYDNYNTQDDHGLHFVGIVKDQENNLYYIAKNSWGEKNNSYRSGHLYASTAYVRGKTISLLVNKNALSKKLKKKLGL